METINELKQKIKNVHDAEFEKLQNLYKELIKTDRIITESEFCYMIQQILMYAFGNKFPEAFYICYATGDLYYTPEVQLNGNLYRIHQNLTNGSMLPFVKAYKLGDVNLFVDKIDVHNKRKQMIHDWFVAAFSSDVEEINSVDNYDELHWNLTENIMHFACKMIQSHC